MTLSSLWHYLWTTRLLLQAALLIWMMARNLYRDFPLFMLYTGSAILQTIVLKAMIYWRTAGSRYFTAYVVGGVLGAALGFAVIYEIFKQAFRDYPALRHLGTTFFRGTLVLFSLIGVVLAWLTPAGDFRLLMSRLDVVQQTVSVMQCGLVIVLLLFFRNLGLSLRSRTFGIALGFGVLASIDLGAFAIRSRIESVTATPMTDLLTVITMTATLFSVVVWTVYLVRPETVSTVAPLAVPTNDLESWSQELRRLLR
jgi:hypothetical protein